MEIAHILGIFGDMNDAHIIVSQQFDRILENNAAVLRDDVNDDLVPSEAAETAKDFLYDCVYGGKFGVLLEGIKRTLCKPRQGILANVCCLCCACFS
ncbi:hypothetical protein ATCV1_z212R [Acanthocystis turfacea chlorella virus 1]|uniref:Uncharacterized protein z212R n=1 Tax=Chlorovirus heliozoae TaxID=322019 RepID=A7K8H2_9PHYC|nr:hypothetical protein ATCV1_z212R [Acanthocystis turfacea chlorella virus 1]ABT16346.1 hypothetical protein ATCV1_z212R [Acanthocystis turfacea chlorella virus 1]